MAILWCGGEDVDFPNGSVPLVSTTSTQFRSGYGRCALGSGTQSRSAVFAGGAVTNAWFTFRYYTNLATPTFRSTGLTYSGVVNAGLWVGVTSGNKVTLFKYDGTTETSLATEAGTSIVANSGSIYRFDVQISNFGASTTVNVYLNGTLVITWTGNPAITGVTSLDQLSFQISGTIVGNALSEFIVSDSDTRGLQGLVTYAPNGNGTTQNWSNPAYTNYNPTTINDTNSTFVNTTTQDEQATVNSAPAGNFQIVAVKVIARALSTSGATATGVALGFNNTNNTTVAVGSAHTATTAFASYEDIFATDPTTGSGWGQNITGYQLNLRSA